VWVERGERVWSKKKKKGRKKEKKEKRGKRDGM
jgi:hypothetical protein